MGFLKIKNFFWKNNIEKMRRQATDPGGKIINHIPENYPEYILKIPQNSIMRNKNTTKTMGKRLQQTIHQIYKDDKQAHKKYAQHH